MSTICCQTGTAALGTYIHIYPLDEAGQPASSTHSLARGSHLTPRALHLDSYADNVLRIDSDNLRLDGYSPQGQHSSIGETQVYISGEASGPSKGTLLLLTDGFGLAVHNLILADRYAAEGWHVVVPDLFEGK